MASKSLPRTNVFERRSSAAHLGRHSDPIMAVGDRTSDGCTTSKRKREEESLNRDKKRSRAAASSAPKTAETKTVPSKRKSTSAETEDRQVKRARQTLSPASESTGDAAPLYGKAVYKAKYKVGRLLGEGGFGAVFAGRRKTDNLPVAIKRIDRSHCEFTQIEHEGKSLTVPLEVALLLKLQPKAAETSAVCALLDWYILEKKVFLVLERPSPCMDLADYLQSKSTSASESEAKILTRQLVDALIEIHSKGVFHNDIKPENILIETGAAVPRVHIIDFGYGTFLSEKYDTPQGTAELTSPEWFLWGSYKAEPATVWQLGVTVFEMLHPSPAFKNVHGLIKKEPRYNRTLSHECLDFLKTCLLKSPDVRATLEELKSHSWLQSTQ